MNWSTRLRRWVRIRTPPVRVASMKPTAATVLPAPVACSNQKRRSAPGSSGPPRRLLLRLLLGGGLLPVLRLLVGGELLVLVRLGIVVLIDVVVLVVLGVVVLVLVLVVLIDVVVLIVRLVVAVLSLVVVLGVLVDLLIAGLVEELVVVVVLVLRHVDFGLRRDSVLGGDLLLGHQLGQRAGERVDLVRVEFGAVAQLRRFVGEQALQPEQQREVAAPLDRGVLGARRRSRSGRRRARAGGRCPGRAPRGPRRRAGTARGRTPPHARYRRLRELPHCAATSLVLAIEGFWFRPRRAHTGRPTGARVGRGCRENDSRPGDLRRSASNRGPNVYVL